MKLGQQAEDAAVSTGNGLCSTLIEDATAQASMQPWIEMECYQLSRGRQLAQMDVLDLGSHQIVQERQMAAVQKMGVTPSNLCTLSYCTPDPIFRFSELGADSADTIFFMPEHTEFDIYVPARAQTTYVSFNQEELLNAARALNPAQWEQIPQKLQQIQTGQQTALKEAIKLWFNTVAALNVANVSPNIDLVRRLLLHNILQVATVSKNADESHVPSVERARAFHICRMARIFVENCLAGDIVPTVVDICKSVSVSERSLQYAFRTYVDLSPLVYLRMCRLNRVRATLRTSHPHVTTVTAVAMRFGFLHLGRFAVDYKQIFNESPSATLAS